VAEQVNNNRMVLLLIAGLPLTMMLAATWLWWFVMRGDLDLIGMVGTANRGQLVQPPRQLQESELRDVDGRIFVLSELEPRWAMLVPAAGEACDASCENSLYMTRQIHIALGKEFNRVRRILVSDSPVADMPLAVAELSDGRPAPSDLVTLLQQEHRGLKAFSSEPAYHRVLFPDYGENRSTWYLADPAGWIMMAYNSDVDYKDVIADIKFLLKNSSQ
jgi:hypothetical protein